MLRLLLFAAADAVSVELETGTPWAGHVAALVRTMTGEQPEKPETPGKASGAKTDADHVIDELVNRIGYCIDPTATTSGSLDRRSQVVANALTRYALAGIRERVNAQMLSSALVLLPGGPLEQINLAGIRGVFDHPIVSMSLPTMNNATTGRAVQLPEPPTDGMDWDHQDNPKKWPDGKCFLHNYDDASAPDPYGCGAFKKTFAPLQKLRTCIASKLINDPLWQNHRERLVNKAGREPQEGQQTQPFRQWCSKRFPLCEDVDALRRAEQIIREFSRWKAPSFARIGGNNIMRDGSRITPETASLISGCFYQGDVAELHAAGRCIPLMYDATEFGSVGISNAVVKFNSPDHVGNGQPRFAKQYRGVPPVCARAAMAVVGPVFDRAKVWKPSEELKHTLFKKGFSFSRNCLHPKSSNCRKFAVCWEKALQRVCNLVPACCTKEPHEMNEVPEEDELDESENSEKADFSGDLGSVGSWDNILD